MAKIIDPSDFEPIAPVQPDAIETAAGHEPDATPDASPSVDSPVSIAEAARILNANESTVRRRWMPRILEAVQGTTIEDQVLVEVGKTKAGNPIQRLSPKGFELLADFQTVAGDVEAIEAWGFATHVLYAPEVVEPEAIEPEVVEPEAEPWEASGALALAPRQESALAVDAAWVEQSEEICAGDWQAIQQSQMDLSQSIASSGDALAQAMRQLAQQQLAQAGSVYQQTIADGLRAIASGNLQAVMGTGQNPSARSSAA